MGFVSTSHFDWVAIPRKVWKGVVAPTVWTKDLLSSDECSWSGRSEPYPLLSVSKINAVCMLSLLNKAALLNKVYQNLKPGGQFASVFPEHQPAVFDCMADLMGQEMAKEMNKDYHWILALEYNHLATAVGFNVTSCNVQNKTLYFTNVETLLKWFCVSTGGRFDPKKVNPATLEEFKWPYGDGPATIEDHHTVTVILSKS